MYSYTNFDKQINARSKTTTLSLTMKCHFPAEIELILVDNT